MVGAVLLIYLVFSGYRGCRELRELQNKAQLASCHPSSIALLALSLAVENHGLCPPLATQPGRLTMSWPDMQRSGWSNARDRVCESAPTHKATEPVGEADRDQMLSDDWSYVYLGYAIENDTQAEAFFTAYPQQIKQPTGFEQDLPMSPGQGTCGSASLARLYLLDRLPEPLSCLTDRAKSIPVVIEWPDNHLYPGGKVVWLDGSEEFVPYPGKFPMTPTFIEGLRRLNTQTP